MLCELSDSYRWCLGAWVGSQVRDGLEYYPKDMARKDVIVRLLTRLNTIVYKGLSWVLYTS